MKILTAVILLFFAISCNKNPNKKTITNTVNKYKLKPSDIGNDSIDINDSYYERMGGFWMYNDKKFTGTITSYSPNGNIKKTFSVYKGKKEFSEKAYFNNGKLKYHYKYLNGKKEGVAFMWHNDSLNHLLSETNYKNGKLHGTQKKWYATGQIFKIRNMKMGTEEGIQQAFRKNGALYSNYEAKNGRIFGLKKSELCFSLKNEEIE